MAAFYIGYSVGLEASDLYELVWAMPKPVELSPLSLMKIDESVKHLDNLISEGAEIYGITTGFGPLVKYSSGKTKNSSHHGQGLINHLMAGVGNHVPEEIVTAAIINRAHTLAQGKSAVRKEFLTWVLANLHNGLVPLVPQIGSLGASGDLVPMSHILQSLLGNGKLLKGDSTLLTKFEPTARESLGFVNGIPLSTAYAIFALEESARTLTAHLELIAHLYSYLNTNAEHVSNSIQRAKKHRGQIFVAKTIRNIMQEIPNNSTHLQNLQEVYSIRCVPQVLGAVYDSFEQARATLTDELNSVDDNPVFEGADVFHGGNFFGQHVAFASDQINAAVTQLAILAERQIADLVDPEISHSEPMLVNQVGANSGLAGAQIVATAIVAEMRSQANLHSTFSISSNGRNQDIVPMAMLAARKAYDNSQLAKKVMAILGIALKQYSHIEQLTDTKLPKWLSEFKGFDQDVPLDEFIELACANLISHHSNSTEIAAK